jgi:glycosyltransferase involved in cell wall biosynthesis
MELVSVIIPTFNSKLHLGETINSVTSQTYSQIEVIVIDDGSSDDTVTIAREQLQSSGSRFQILELGSNKGPSGARNVGIRVANGSWVQFLDSDDLLMARKIEKEMAVAAVAGSDVAAVYSPWNWGLIEDGQIDWFGPLIDSVVPGQAPAMCFAAGRRPLLGACLIRRSALEKTGGFDEELRFWECEDACAKLAAVGRFVPSKSAEAEYLWRLHKGKPYIAPSGGRYNSGEVSRAWISLVLRAAGHRSLDALNMPEADKRLLREESTTWGRMAYASSRDAFREYLRLARILDPNLAPTSPFYASALARWIGYEGVEAVELFVRQPKAWVRSALERLKLKNPPRYRLLDFG